MVGPPTRVDPTSASTRTSVGDMCTVRLWLLFQTSVRVVTEPISNYTESGPQTLKLKASSADKPHRRFNVVGAAVESQFRRP